MFPQLNDDIEAPIFRQQLPLLRQLTEAAFLQCPPASNPTLIQLMQAILQGGDILHYMNDKFVLDSLVGETIAHFNAGRLQEALLWGRLNHVASRRFCHCWLPFIYIIAASGAVPSFELPDISTANESRIPKEIVQYWDKSVPPDDVATLINEWRDRSVGYLHRLFDNAQARQFIADCYGADLLEIYDSAEHPAGKSDMFRLLWLARNGGIYVDADDRCAGDVGRLLPANSGFVVNWSPGPPPCVNNWFIGARPHHPAVISALTLAVCQIRFAAKRGLRLSPWTLSGPCVFSSIIMDEVAMNDGMPSDLEDMSFQREAQYRAIVQPVDNLEYRKDKTTNWKLAF